MSYVSFYHQTRKLQDCTQTLQVDEVTESGRAKITVTYTTLCVQQMANLTRVES